MQAQTRSILATAPVFAMVPAKDLKRAREFWEQKVGVETVESTTPGMFMVFGGKGTRMAVYETQASGGDATAATFLVEDVGAVVRELRERGVRFEDYDMPGLKTENGIAHYSEGEAAWFKDTEGNVIGLATA